MLDARAVIVTTIVIGECAGSSTTTLYCSTGGSNKK